MSFMWMMHLILLLLYVGQAIGATQHSLLDGISWQALSAGNASSECEDQLMALHVAWQQGAGWALKAFDASGSGYQDFMLGTGHWLGNAHTCRAVNEAVLRYYTLQQDELLNHLAPFPFSYRVAYVRVESEWKLRLEPQLVSMLHIGLCVPHSCQPPELEQLLRQVLAADAMRYEQLEMQLQLAYTKDPQESGQILHSWAFIALCAVLGSVTLLTILASSGSSQSRFIACFDMHSNWQRLNGNIASAKDEIGVIKGLRVVAAIALLIVHVVYYPQRLINLSANLANLVSRFFMHNGYMIASLEVFFTISGFLCAHSLVRNAPLQQQLAEEPLRSNVGFVWRQALHRYLRLVPLECVLIPIFMVSLGHMRDSSVFHMVEPVVEQCEQYWWRNLLLIQNFYAADMCINWSWYLSVDMHLHLAAMLLFVLYTRHPRLVRRLVVVLVLVNYVYTVTMLMVLGVERQFGSVHNVMPVLYFNSWPRSLTYMIGGIYGHAMALGWRSPLDAVFPNRPAKLLLTGAILWLFGQMLTDHPVGNLVVACAFMTMRVVVSGCTAELIFRSYNLESRSVFMRCVVGCLQSKYFDFPSRLTFSFYLINALVTIYIHLSFSSTLPTDLTVMFILLLACGMISYVLSIPMTLFLEMPLTRLASVCVNTKHLKSKAK